MRDYAKQQEMINKKMQEDINHLPALFFKLYIVFKQLQY